MDTVTVLCESVVAEMESRGWVRNDLVLTGDAAHRPFGIPSTRTYFAPDRAFPGDDEFAFEAWPWQIEMSAEEWEGQAPGFAEHYISAFVSYHVACAPVPSVTETGVRILWWTAFIRNGPDDPLAGPCDGLLE